MAGNGDGFSPKIDVLIIGAVGNEYRIPIRGGIDPCLDGGLVAGDMDDLGGCMEYHAAQDDDGGKKFFHGSEVYKPIRYDME
jgi:hypothetical protein